MRCALASDALIATAVNPSYSISNMALVQVYSKLDSPRNDLVLK